MTRVALVGCASQKLKRPAPARELYTSQLFRKASAYAMATCDEWYILSAKYGLVHPDAVIEPYDMKLGTKTGPVFGTWKATVLEQLAEVIEPKGDVQLVALCGAVYRDVIYNNAYQYEVPMKGLGIGQQLGFLTTELKQMGVSA